MSPLQVTCQLTPLDQCREVNPDDPDSVTDTIPDAFACLGHFVEILGNIDPFTNASLFNLKEIARHILKRVGLRPADAFGQGWWELTPHLWIKNVENVTVWLAKDFGDSGHVAFGFEGCDRPWSGNYYSMSMEDAAAETDGYLAEVLERERNLLKGGAA